MQNKQTNVPKSCSESNIKLVSGRHKLHQREGMNIFADYAKIDFP